ncbi:MAG: hypothetical protein ACJ8M1_12955 [Chthoniobacterales bacterium]
MTKQILFRPFDLKKWLVIGFAAWLAHLGGTNFNFRYNQGDFRHIRAFDGFRDTLHHTASWVIVTSIVVLVVLFLILALVFTWLRARGAFMFIDCIVRNRAAIAEPWREFRKIGNSFFLFSLIVTLVFLVIAGTLAVPFIFLMVRGQRTLHHLGPIALSTVIGWAAVIFVLAMAWVLIRNLMLPIMYRRRCLAAEGFRAALSLVNSYPGEITVYCLFWIAIGIGFVITACVAICLTCCIVAIPYVGTVILLPLYVCLAAFTLLFLRQFGPDYDVWATLPRIATTPVIAEPTAAEAAPPPPLPPL